MHKGKYVFIQLLYLLDRNDFNYLARKYAGDKYVKQFTCYHLLGQREQKEVHILHKYTDYQPSSGCGTLSQQMADSAFLQVDQTTSEDKRVLGYVRKRSPHSDLLCDHSLQYDGHWQKKMNIERPIYEMLVIVSISFTYTISLKDLFAKPNYNIINELDGSTEPTLF